MRNVFGLAGIFFLGFVYVGCTSVSGNVESAVSFSKPIPIDSMITGSFTYNINDAYIVRPDGSLIAEPALLERRTHEAYYEEVVVDSEGKPVLNQDGKPTTKVFMKSDYHMASYDELYSWAIRRAAEKAGITLIFAVKSFLSTTSTGAIGVAVVARQDVTITVYGEAPVTTAE